MAAQANSQNGDMSGYVSGGSTPPRLPPILQVEKQQVTTSATQAASASRRRNQANFLCPVPGCGSTFTRRFNLRGTSSVRVESSSRALTHLSCLSFLIGHLRSHTEERPYVCEWPGCNKGFARQHDCKCVFTNFSPSPCCDSSVLTWGLCATAHLFLFAFFAQL